MRKVFRFTFVLLALASLGSPGNLQAATTGTLFGVVTDAQASALPGVTVTASSPALQGTRTATTNNGGEYQLPLLPPGNYKVEFVISGFEKVVRDSVVVSLDQTTRINVSLSLAKVTEAVTVIGDTVVIDPTQTNTQQNFKEDHLKYATIGQAGRTYQGVLQQAGGVAGGANPNVLGANLGQNIFLLDGVNTTDPVTHTFGSNLAFDAIQEVSIQTSGFEAEYGKAVGGLINVITKSGGNQFSGSLDIRYSTEDFTEQGEKLQPALPGETPRLRYDKNTQDFQNLKPASTLGGPFLRDRVWFFLTAERVDNKTQPPTTLGFTPGRRDFMGWNLFGKVTATPLTNHSLAFKYTNNFADIPHSQNSSIWRPEAGSLQQQGGYIYNLSYDAVLTSQWLANLQGSINNTYLSSTPMSGNRLTTGSIDRSTGERSVNHTNFQSGDRERTQVLGSTTYYLEALGSHAFKGGVDFEWTQFPNENNPTGTPIRADMCTPQFFQPPGAVCGAINRPNRGAPSLYDVITILPRANFEAQAQSFYVQDEWRPIPQLTIKPGVRYDRNAFDVNDGSRATTLSRVQPRLGVAWDLFNNSKTILRANAGEFMDDNALTLSLFLDTRGAVTSRFLWSAAQQRYNFNGAFGGASGNQLDPSLDPTYAQVLTLGVTQRLFTNTSLEVTGIYQKTKDIFEDACRDGVCATPAVPFWLTNRPNGDANALRNNFRGIVFKIESRPTSKVDILFNYTLSKARTSVEYTQNAGTDFDVFPDHHVNRYGFAGFDARHRVKLDGFVRLPWEITVGTNFIYDSGTPFNITSTDAPNAGYGVVFLEPRGSRRLSDFYQWDLQVQKDFVIGPVRAGLIGSVFNVLDTEIATARNGSVGTGTLAVPNNPRFLFETSWQRPRRYEVGFRLEF